MRKRLNVLYPHNNAKLNLLFCNFLNFKNIQGSTFLKKAGMNLNHIKEENNTENIEKILNKQKNKTRFLFCPRCGLRRPASENLVYFGGHCPSCGCRMVEEGLLPYSQKGLSYP